MNQQGLELILGATLPPFIDFINVRFSNTNVRYLISVVVCILVGVVSTFIMGQLNLTDVLTSAGLVFASAQTTYRLFWVDKGKKLMLNHE